MAVQTPVALKGKIYQEPVKKLTFPGLGHTAIYELVPGPKVNAFIATTTVTGSATGAATKTVPRPSWGVGDMRFKLGQVNRARKASELFGLFGLQARNQVGTAGTVQYFQAGAVITVALDGLTIGAVPVLIDSAEDVALQGALANNTATVAVFYLPWMFAEFFRKDPQWGGCAMGLPTAFSDGTTLGTPYFEYDVPAATGVAGTMTAVNFSASAHYVEEVAEAGSQVRISKQKIHTAAYAVGDTELANNFDTTGILQRFSVLTAADKITKIIVKHGSRVVREVTFGESHVADLFCEIVAGGSISNRFDIDLDQDDDPTRGLLLSGTQALSIMATFASANDAPATVRILADYYGPVEA